MSSTSTRRSRPPRSRKTRTTEPPQSASFDAALQASQTPLESHASHDPTQTGQLRALEMGWDELLS